MTTSQPQSKRTDPNSSDFRSSAWNRQASAWAMTADLWESALHIREKGEAYLTKFKNEPDAKYSRRLADSVFNNRFREAIESMAGTVFRSDPAPKEAPPALAELFTDIDLCGNTLHRFLLNAFELFLRDGNGYFYVDAPPLTKEQQAKVAAGEKLTQADRRNDRPFVVFYTASQLINHRFERVNGRDVLVRATLEETVLKPDGEFGEKEVKRHRVLTPGAYEVREWNDDAKEFVKVPDASGTTGLSYIPLTPICEPGTTPPLLVLAMLNLLYYNKISDFDDWCHVACVPERVYKLNDKNDLEAFTKDLKSVAPGIARILWGEHAEASFNEVTGAGIEVAAARNKEIADEMASIGIGMFAPTENAAKSATEIVDAAGKRQSKLARYAREFENAVEKTLYTLAEYLNAIKGAGTVVLQKPAGEDGKDAESISLSLSLDYDRLSFDINQLHFFKEMVDAGTLSLETFLTWLPKVTDMPDGFTVEDELERIKNQPKPEAKRSEGI